MTGGGLYFYSAIFATQKTMIILNLIENQAHLLLKKIN
jgi:hypothetical protein